LLTEAVPEAKHKPSKPWRQKSMVTEITEKLSKEIARMTEKGAIKPTARTGTARDPLNPNEPQSN